jgi:hypothetical protein
MITRPIQEADPMRAARCLLWLALSIACVQAAPAPPPKPAKQPPLTAERLRALLGELPGEEKFWDIESTEQRGPATWEVVGRRGTPWCDQAWVTRTFLVSGEMDGAKWHLKAAEVAARNPDR